MSSKRKSVRSSSTSRQRVKRTKSADAQHTPSSVAVLNVDNAVPVQHENDGQGLSNVDINSLTETITKTVTTAVLSNLQALGILANRLATPASSSGQSDPTHSIMQTDAVVGQPSQSVPTNEQCMPGTHISTSNELATSAPLSVPGVVSSQASSASDSFAAHMDAAKTGFVSAAIPLHSRVPMKTKEKIWADEYVELSTLQDENVDDVTISVQSGQISTTSSAKKKFLTVEQWTDAFGVFSSVYRLKYPSQSEQLSTYMGVVRKIANEKGAWHYYDTNFRKIKGVCNLSWDQIHSELYVTALSRKQLPRFRAGRDLPGKERSRSTIAYTCHKYNKGTYCSGCDYRHVCKYSNCGGKHPGYKCWKNSSRHNINSSAAEQSDQQPPHKKSQTQHRPSSIPRSTNSSQVGNPK